MDPPCHIYTVAGPHEHLDVLAGPYSYRYPVTGQSPD
jgi:hypothetical protein